MGVSANGKRTSFGGAEMILNILDLSLAAHTSLFYNPALFMGPQGESQLGFTLHNFFF